MRSELSARESESSMCTGAGTDLMRPRALVLQCTVQKRSTLSEVKTATRHCARDTHDTKGDLAVVVGRGIATGSIRCLREVGNPHAH